MEKPDDILEGEVQQPPKVEQGGNSVDVSADSVDAEWARIVIEHETGAIPNVGQGEEGGIKFEHPLPSDPKASFEEKKKMAAIVIKQGMKFAFSALGGLDIPDDKYNAISEAYAALIAKHYQGGIFEFLAKYREEITAIGATLAFIGAVRSAVVLKRAQADDEKLASGGKGGSSEKV